MLYKVTYMNNPYIKAIEPSNDLSMELDVDEVTLTTERMEYERCKEKVKELEQRGYTVISIG